VRLLACLALACVVVSACGSPASPISGTVQVLGSWSGAELKAFEAVVAPFEASTGVRVEYEVTRDLRGVLADRIAAGTPPDIAGLEGPAHMHELAASDRLRDLNDVLDMGSYRGAVAPTFIELGTVDRRFVGAFVRSSLKGLIWYSPQVYRLGTPQTWDELQRLALQAGSRATAEWCVGLASAESSGWPGTDLVEQFLLRTGGPRVYDAWVAGSLPWTSPEVRRAFELYGQVVADGPVLGGPTGVIGSDFRVAGMGLFSDPPGCLFHPQGSFMPSFFEASGLQPGEDFDFFPFPPIESGSSRTVIGAGDLLGLLTDDRAAEALMRYLVSEEAQSLWVGLGGSLSVLSSVTDYPDDISRRAGELLTSADAFRFDASDQMSAALNEAFWQSMIDVTAEPRQLDAILRGLEAVRLTGHGGSG
jgi:alpha-glucoside transport system substrate-binding protein